MAYQRGCNYCEKDAETSEELYMFEGMIYCSEQCIIDLLSDTCQIEQIKGE